MFPLPAITLSKLETFTSPRLMSQEPAAERISSAAEMLEMRTSVEPATSTLRSEPSTPSLSQVKSTEPASLRASAAGPTMSTLISSEIRAGPSLRPTLRVLPSIFTSTYSWILSEVVIFTEGCSVDWVNVTSRGPETESLVKGDTVVSLVVITPLASTNLSLAKMRTAFLFTVITQDVEMRVIAARPATRPAILMIFIALIYFVCINALVDVCYCSNTSGPIPRSCIWRRIFGTAFSRKSLRLISRTFSLASGEMK